MRFLMVLSFGWLALGQPLPQHQQNAQIVVGANLPSQRIGINDLLNVNIYGAPE